MRRSPSAYAQLVAAESAALPDGPLPELISFGHYSGASPAAAQRCRWSGRGCRSSPAGCR
ncbi:hypothetical protein [Catellatospora sp. NPDC049609]|uniref:hypothetical protein n=1 Tax=Catellatospora sp. NPDC049609 TaxID=3155505 RepID=UPI00341EE31F